MRNSGFGELRAGVSQLKMTLGFAFIYGNCHFTFVLRLHICLLMN